MRKIAYHSDFEDQLRQAELEFPRLEEFLVGLKLKLRRNPEFGTQVSSDPPVWFVGAPDVFPATIGVSYTFDEERVILMSLWIG